MRVDSAHASLLIALLLAPAWAQAQPIYRCGDTYSQVPCPGGSRVDADDARTRKQQSESQQATQRDLRAAQALEKSRLKEEAAAHAASRSEATARTAGDSDNKPAGTGAQATQATGKHRHKGKAPRYFTARAAAEKKPAKQKGN